MRGHPWIRRPNDGPPRPAFSHRHIWVNVRFRREQRGVTAVMAARWLSHALTGHDDLDDAGRSQGGAATWRPVLKAWREQITGTLEQISGLRHEGGETHHRVFLRE